MINASGQQPSYAIETTNLVKKFGSLRALDGLNLSVADGEIHGFLGPNGAGKSTTIRVLLGLLHKSGGTVKLLGGNPWKNAVRLHRNLAYVPGEVNLWPNLSGGEAVDLFARLRGKLDTKRRNMLYDRFELDPTKKCRTYSKGNRQKVALIAAFASDVDLYLLDEPTTGLDPLMEAKFQQTVREIKDAGKTILLSSHILAEVEALCDRVTIINEGKAVESGTLSELRHLTRTSVKVNTVKPIHGLREMTGLFDLKLKGTYAQFEVETDKIDAPLQQLLKFDIVDLQTSPPTLEDLFMRHYGDKKTHSRKTKDEAED